MSFPRSLILLIFFFLLSKMLCAWPGEEKEPEGNKKITIAKKNAEEERKRMINYPSDERSPSILKRSSTIGAGGPQEIQEEASDSNVIGHLGEASVQVTENALMESDQVFLEQILARINPAIAEGIKDQKAPSLDYHQKAAFQKRLISTLPDQVRETFQGRLASAKKLEAEAEEKEKSNSFLSIFDKEEVTKLRVEAASLRREAYEEREKYLRSQLRDIEALHLINDLLNQSQEKFKQTIQAAEGFAEKIQPTSSLLFGSLLSCFSSTDTEAMGLLEEFKKATSYEQRSTIINKIKKMEWNVNFSEFEKLTANFENKKELVRQLETIVPNFPLPTKQRNQIIVPNFPLPTKQRNQIAEKIFSLPFIEEWMVALDHPDRMGCEDLVASLKEKRQETLTQIKTLVLDPSLIESLEGVEGREKIPIDTFIVSLLVDQLPINVPTESSLEETKQELVEAIFRFFCADLALKLEKIKVPLSCPSNREPEKLITANKENDQNSEEVLFDKAFNKLMELRKDGPSSPELKKILLCAELFLDMMSFKSFFTVWNPRFDEEWSDRIASGKDSAFKFLNRVASFIDNPNNFNDPTSEMTLANARELFAVRDSSNWSIFRINLEGRNRARASVAELNRAVRDQQNKEVAQDHLQAALLLMKSAREASNHGKEVPHSRWNMGSWKKDNALSLKMRCAGELYAMAAYRRRKINNLLLTSDKKPEEYINLAKRALAGEENEYKPSVASIALGYSEQFFYEYSCGRKPLLDYLPWSVYSEYSEDIVPLL
ncbi:MAG: hypothetical protein K2W97_08990 [Chthoniobacterales bacterium]|nr:hypothetical protein [Chthoniobacterales bacterium]